MQGDIRKSSGKGPVPVRDFTGSFYLIYRVGRFVFSASLFFLFLSIQSVANFPFPENSIVVLAVFFVISSILLLFSGRHTLMEFVFDEVILLLLVVYDVFSPEFLTIFLMFPVFFSALLLPRGGFFTVTPLAVALNAFVLYREFSTGVDTTVQVILGTIALTAIMLAGRGLREKLERQERYIAKLEAEMERNKVYRKLYEMSADLAHELKNPLASIRGAVELMKEGKASNRLIGIVLREVERLSGIVRDFLLLARPVSSEPTEVSLKELVEEVASAVKRKGVSYEFNLEEAVLKTDRRALYVVVENLLRNAVQWARSKVVISCGRRDHRVFLTVEDDGPGIPEEEREKVFEPFYSKHPEGSGLGLPIVQRFVAESGGSVEVEDSPLGGARFTLELPEGTGDEGSGSGR